MSTKKKYTALIILALASFALSLTSSSDVTPSSHEKINKKDSPSETNYTTQRIASYLRAFSDAEIEEAFAGLDNHQKILIDEATPLQESLYGFEDKDHAYVIEKNGKRTDFDLNNPKASTIQEIKQKVKEIKSSTNPSLQKLIETYHFYSPEEIEQIFANFEEQQLILADEEGHFQPLYGTDTQNPDATTVIVVKEALQHIQNETLTF